MSTVTKHGTSMTDSGGSRLPLWITSVFSLNKHDIN